MDESLSAEWIAYCGRGNYTRANQRKSVEKSLSPDGVVRGFYSDLPLDPTLPHTHSMYPSHDHITHPRDDREMVVDARIVNDMKSHLSEAEFWMLVEHLYAVGVAKKKIPSETPRRLADDWSSLRHFGKEE